MQNKKELVAVLWIIALVGIFFVSRGMTGKIISVNDYCKNDKECRNNEICCITNVDRGVCVDQKVCENFNYSKEIPEKNSYDIMLGVLILMCVLIAFYSVKIRNKKTPRKRKK